MYRLVSIVALALCLAGCGSGTLILNKDGIDWEPRRDDDRSRPDSNQRFACQMDYKCTQPLTNFQEVTQRRRERDRAAKASAAAREPARLPAFRLDRDVSCESDCTPPQTRSLLLPAEQLPALPDPLER
ncbi:MAG: hypothetical protein AAGA41_07390 [Pseudomonadota bacterium]